MKAGDKQTEVGVIPQECRLPTIGDEFDIQLGKMLDAEKNTGILKPFLGNKAVQWNHIDVTHLSEMAMSPADLQRYRLLSGDLLVCEGGEVGRARSPPRQDPRAQAGDDAGTAHREDAASMSTAPPVCRIIAGPNGAGKTTFALTYLPEVAQGSAFVNADLIAAGLSPLAPERQLVAASRLFLSEIERAIRANRDFAFETTLAGRGYLRLIRRLRALGWRVELLYLALPTVEMSWLRVAERVAHGGHSIPRADIERRFPRSLHNLLHLYAAEASSTRCFLNSAETPELVFVQQSEARTLLQPKLFEHLIREANQ